MTNNITDTSSYVWSGNWEMRIADRIHALGCSTFVAFLNMFPLESYDDLAKKLGSDVAPIQVIHLQLKQSSNLNYQKDAARDSLVRVLRERCKRGWGKGIHWNRQMSRMYSIWVTMAPMDGPTPELCAKRKAVWQVLENLPPREGWVPQSIDDSIIEEVFNKGWNDLP